MVLANSVFRSQETLSVAFVHVPLALYVGLGIVEPLERILLLLAERRGRKNDGEASQIGPLDAHTVAITPSISLWGLGGGRERCLKPFSIFISTPNTILTQHADRNPESCKSQRSY